MLKGIYTAASGMKFQIDALNEVAANMANVATPGYKKQEIIGQSFDNLVYQFAEPTPTHHAGAGVVNAGRFRFDSQGALVRTNNPLNFALSGEGYFQTATREGSVALTRNGDFHMDNEGFLATQTGERVLGVDNAPIQLGTATDTVTVRADGAILSGNNEVGRLKVVAAAEANPMTFPQSNVNAQAVGAGFTVEQGYLENSNVNVVAEMVNMIAINKAFSIQKSAITAQDKLLEKTVNDLGRVG
jgi:flagellar basal-body rod protein FlgG